MDADGWNERYQASEMVWSAGPNQFVEQICTPLPPGRAIDLAAGEGRNAIWLAERGWEALAVDFSDAAIDKARRLAEARGVTIVGEVADLTTYVPAPGRFDLVVIAYLQLPDDQLAPILQRAADGVSPGGVFVLVAHDRTNLKHGYGGPPSADVLTTPEQVVAAIGDRLVIERAEVAERTVRADDGDRTALDTVVVARHV